MRYLALITVINSIFVATFFAVSNSLWGADVSWPAVIFFTIVTVVIGLGAGLTLDLAGVLLVRRVASGTFWPLLAIGAAVGAFTGWLFDLPGERFWLVGSVLGIISAVQWWYFVERHPDRRAYFD